jgi:hypothetical protein
MTTSKNFQNVAARRAAIEQADRDQRRARPGAEIPWRDKAEIAFLDRLRKHPKVFVAHARLLEEQLINALDNLAPDPVTRRHQVAELRAKVRDLADFGCHCHAGWRWDNGTH